MSKDRASIFESSELDELDLAGFAPKSGPDRKAPLAADVRAVAEAANSPSRAGTPPAPPKPDRRPPRLHRTGRNVQFNLKASQKAIDAFYAISDEQGWVLGETFERAIAALGDALAREGKSGAV